eukprot:CAMPEP_0119143606 /NCGR_PEP_ID=MMETSP1310-20130426/34600_1 /TAXON_ID=464262 /ORGANISM="Genus nov. species nov., Strain RCC2339" /LENGTH=514 /DNA_ID=CAMNT_0007135247 /DNA_START=205 /DNA_END=1745 /DNA_ORIENTATION=-
MAAALSVASGSVVLGKWWCGQERPAREMRAGDGSCSPNVVFAEEDQSGTPHAQDSRQLVMAVNVFRHGDRQPIWFSLGSFKETKEESTYWESQQVPKETQQFWTGLFPLRRVARVAESLQGERLHEQVFSDSVVGLSPTDYDRREGEEADQYFKDLFDPSLPASSLSEKNTSEFSRGLLTKRGAWDLQCVGRRLRERYAPHFPFLADAIPGGAAKAEVFARATPYPRTIQSTQNVLAGLLYDDVHFNFLYPNAAMARRNLHPAPMVPVHVRPRDLDILFPNRKVFPKIGEWWLALRNEANEAVVTGDFAKARPSPLSLNFNTREIADAVTKLFAIPDGAYANFNAIQDMMRTRGRHNLPLPPSITPTMFDRVLQINSWIWHQVLSEPGMEYYSAAFLLSEILCELKAHVDADSAGLPNKGPRIVLYGGHDTTLLPLMTYLGVYDGVWPRYGATLSFELWKCDGDQGPAYSVLILRDGVPLSLDRFLEENAGARPGAGGYSCWEDLVRAAAGKRR